MLIQPDRNELGDKRLNPEEGVAKLKEDNEALRKQLGHHIANQETLSREKLSTGNRMEWRELCRRLKLLNPYLLISDGGARGPSPAGIIGGMGAIAVRYAFGTLKDPNEDERGTYITGFWKDVLPEFSWVELDDTGVPCGEHRGWRTVVRKVWERGLCNGTDVLRVFGDVMSGGQARGELHQKSIQEKHLS